MFDIPFRERLTCTIPEAMTASGLGRSSLYVAIADGRLKVTKFGARTLISVPSLVQLVEPGSPSVDIAANEVA